MKCINCGKYPFCNKIENAQQESCEKFIKRKLIITTDSPVINEKKRSFLLNFITENLDNRQVKYFRFRKKEKNG